MINTLSISVSGLIAQSTKIAASASNIANASVSGTSDPNDLSDPYTPLDVSLTSTSQNGVASGVSATVITRTPASVISYSPDSPLADESGTIAVPNVNINEEIVNTIQASQAYKANLQLIPTTQEMFDALLNALDENA